MKKVLAIIFLILAPLVIFVGIAASVAHFVVGDWVNGLGNTFCTLLWAAAMAWTWFGRLDDQ